MENKICLGCVTPKHITDLPTMLKLRALLATAKDCLNFLVYLSGVDSFTDRIKRLQCRRALDETQELCQEIGITLDIRYDAILPDIEKALDDVTKTKEILQPHVQDIVLAMASIEYK